MEAQQEQQGQAVPAADAASEASSTASTVSAISRHVHDLQLEVNILGHRCIHLEERLRALEDQQSSVQRRLSWLETSGAANSHIGLAALLAAYGILAFGI